ncbi:MAG TPA: hypothetical protein VFG11_05500 [Acidobacteriota bacterium]|nr:hypothetical protein [Acidobacteriota bacterium]
MKRTICFAILTITLSAYLLSGSQQISQIVSPQHVHLGQPVFWSIQIRHPYWERYKIQIQPCKGTEISVIEETTLEEGQNLRTDFRLQIIPVALSTPDTPSVLIVDAKGQSTALSGSPLQVVSISGNSMTLKEPQMPFFEAVVSNRRWILICVALAGMLLLWLIIRKILSPGTGASAIAQELRAALKSLSKTGEAAPGSWLAALRSTPVWGFDAAALSINELSEKAASIPDLTRLATAMNQIENSRYSGAKRIEPAAAKEAIESALARLKRKTRNGASKS